MTKVYIEDETTNNFLLHALRNRLIHLNNSETFQL